MQGGGGSAPQFNNQQVAKDQQTANVQTGIANAWLNNTNQITPYGNLTYDQTGFTYDNQGNQIPRFTATQTLSPDQQAILDKTTGIQKQALDIAPGLLTNVNNAISKPLDFSGAPALPANGQAARDQAFEALMSRGRTELDRTRAAGEAQATNQGIAPGSEAWKRATQGWDQANVDLTNQATLAASQLAGQDLSQAQGLRNQWLNETLTQRNQPIQDITALLGLGGGVQQPSFVNTPQSTIPATDTTSPALAQYQGQLQQQQMQQSAQNAMLGGLFGLGGAGLFGLGSYLGRR